jgi:riboflavin biosynthesis pyrimidine reductase
MLDVLFESPGLPRFAVPEPIEAAYGAPIGFDAPRVIANFVSTLDGVAALPNAERSSALIGGGNRGDRFVMGMLRAAAEVVLVGAGTLRSHPASLWTPADAFPQMAREFAGMRSALGRAPEPAIAIVTASGKVDLSHPGLARGAIVITTADGAKRLREGQDARRVDVAVAGDGDEVEGAEILRHIGERGYALTLTEGGPTLFGRLLRDGLVDELFLTLSNRVGGRAGYEQRAGIVEDAAFLPGVLKTGELLSARRFESHLLLRYAVRAAPRAAAGPEVS